MRQPVHRPCARKPKEGCPRPATPRRPGVPMQTAAHLAAACGPRMPRCVRHQRCSQQDRADQQQLQGQRSPLQRLLRAAGNPQHAEQRPEHVALDALVQSPSPLCSCIVIASAVPQVELLQQLLLQGCWDCNRLAGLASLHPCRGFRRVGSHGRSRLCRGVAGRPAGRRRRPARLPKEPQQPFGPSCWRSPCCWCCCCYWGAGSRGKNREF